MSELEPIEPRILARAEHTISRKNISREALKVLYRLADGGHRAYLVGGSVRDLMLGREPKDFDVATDARPNEVRKLFRNARVIGRRFRLAHVIFRDEVVEVSTFRREPDPAEQRSDDPDDLLITSDNTFGTPEEDARRRDFTVNALFYSISDFSVIDYVGGVADLERRTIRTIGDPLVRFREDPVRMMRACELAGRLGFGIDSATQAAIQELAGEIARAAPARLAEELLELLRCGRSGAALQWMLELGLLGTLLPEAYAMITAGERGLGDFGRMLPTLDRKMESGREVGDGGLLASLLLPSVLLRRFDVEAVGQRALRRAELRQLTEEVAAPFFERFALSKERTRRTTEALHGFHRLCERRNAAERVRVAAAPWFTDALWLFELLADATGEGHQELAQWQAAARRRPVLAAPGEGGAGEPTRQDQAAQPARRRRRRRRR